MSTEKMMESLKGAYPLKDQTCVTTWDDRGFEHSTCDGTFSDGTYHTDYATRSDSQFFYIEVEGVYTHSYSGSYVEYFGWKEEDSQTSSTFYYHYWWHDSDLNTETIDNTYDSDTTQNDYNIDFRRSDGTTYFSNSHSASNYSEYVDQWTWKDGTWQRYQSTSNYDLHTYNSYSGWHGNAGAYEISE